MTMAQEIRDWRNSPGWSSAALVEFAAALDDLSELAPGWDSYGALRIDEEARREAWLWAYTRIPCGSPVPQVVPTVRGGVQLEWHEQGWDIEVLFEPGKPPRYSADREGEEPGAASDHCGEVVQALQSMRVERGYETEMSDYLATEVAEERERCLAIARSVENSARLFRNTFDPGSPEWVTWDVRVRAASDIFKSIRLGLEP